MDGIFLVTEAYRFLMVVAAMCVCLAHGSNDVANAITPLLVVLRANGITHSKTPYVVGSLGISIGLLLMGQKVMNTLGKKVIKLNFVKGFCAQFATGISVIVGSMLGMPLSTTHCMVGSLFGIVLAEKFAFIKCAYLAEDQKDYIDDGSIQFADLGVQHINDDRATQKLDSEDGATQELQPEPK